MYNEDVIGDIAGLINENGNPCVSLIIPLLKKAPGKQTNLQEIKRILADVNTRLSLNYNQKVTNDLMKKINRLLDDVDFIHIAEGIGIFVSQHIVKRVFFPFQVTEKIFVASKFEIRDLIFLQRFLEEYYVLSLSEKSNALYRGIGGRLEKITDDFFPATYTDDYEYEHSARGTSFGFTGKAVEKDKSELLRLRLLSFFKTIDKHMKKYISGDAKLILSGPKKEVALFINSSLHAENIVGKVFGNYSKDEFRLGDLSWEKIIRFRRMKQQKLLEQLKESKGKMVYGLADVWKEANEGKGLKLLVGKDYRRYGFLDQEKQKFSMRKPASDHFIVYDAVEQVIKTVLEKNGMVEFMEDEVLKEYKNIALLERY